ncbi:MAG: Ig domain-containing protein [Pseudomonadota bacterium]
MKFSHFTILSCFFGLSLIAGCGGGSNSNTAPTISGSPSIQITERQTYRFIPSASDREGDELTFSVVNLPSFLALDSQTGELSGQPSVGDVGIYTDITISVSDGALSESLPSFDLQVLEFFYEFSIHSSVIGENMSFAQVSLNYNGNEQNTEADSSGAFEFTLRARPSDSTSTELISIKAVGKAIQSQVELISVIGTIEDAFEKAGEDQILSPSESERVTVSSLSTAKYLLAAEVNDGEPPSSISTLTLSESSMPPSLLLEVAALINLIESDENYSVDTSKTTLSQFFPLDTPVTELLKTWQKSQGIDDTDGTRVDPNFDTAIQNSQAEILETPSILPSVTREQLEGLNVFGVAYPTGLYANNNNVLEVNASGRTFLSYSDRGDDADYGWLYQYDFSSSDLDGESVPMSMRIGDSEVEFFSETPFDFTINRGTGFDSRGLHRYNFDIEDRENIEDALDNTDLEVSTEFQLSFKPIAMVDRGLLAIQKRTSFTTILSEEFARAGIERNDVLAEKTFEDSYVLLRTSETLQSMEVADLQFSNQKWVLPTYVTDSDLPPAYSVDLYELDQNGNGQGKYHDNAVTVSIDNSTLSIVNDSWNVEARVYKQEGDLAMHMVVLTDPDDADSFSKVSTIARQNTLTGSPESYLVTDWPTYLQDGMEYARDFENEHFEPSGLFFNDDSVIRRFGISPDNRDCIDESRNCFSSTANPFIVTDENEIFYEYTNSIGEFSTWFSEDTIEILGVSEDRNKVVIVTNDYTYGNNNWNRTSLEYYLIEELENAEELLENSINQW